MREVHDRPRGEIDWDLVIDVAELIWEPTAE
jgi:hypothetical protein